jgi:hypothetical protein
MDGEKGQDRDVLGAERRGSVINGIEDEDGSNHSKSRPRNSISTYAAPTRSSQAKKNDKVEPPSRPGSIVQRTSSMHERHSPSILQRSNSTFRSNRTESAASTRSVPERRDEPHQTRSHTFHPADGQEGVQEGVAAILNVWKQEETRYLKADLGMGGDERLEKEEEGAMNRNPETTKGELENLRQRNDELVARIHELEAASMEHNKILEDRLQSCKTDTEKWKQKHDEVFTRNQELEEKVEARNRLEPGLVLNEETEAENKRLRATVIEMRNDISKIKTELKKRDAEVRELNEHAEHMENEALESSKTFRKLQKSICDMSEIMSRWIQTMSGGASIDPTEVNDLIRSCADDAETKQLLVSTRQLLNMFVEKNEFLDRQLEDKKYEISNITKAIEEQSRDIAPLSPGLLRPMSPLHLAGDNMEQLYREERQRRKAAEEKFNNLVAVHKQESQLEQVKEEPESRLMKVQEENTILLKEAEEAKQQSKEWKHEMEQKQEQLDQRTENFQSYVDQKEKEIDQYIKTYRDKAKDVSHWESRGLQRQLEAQERDYESLKQIFDSSKRMDEWRQKEIGKLEKKTKIQSAHITNLEQAYYLGNGLPIMPSLQDIDDEDDYISDSDSDALTPSSPQPPRFSARPRKIPRCQFPPAVAARRARLEAYRAELRAKTEEEVRDFNFNPPGATSKRDGDAAGADDIMDKVRRWKLGDWYPKSKEGWGQIRKRSLWERWGGGEWAA